MIFLDLEHLLKSEFGISLNELLYKTDQKKRQHILHKIMDLAGNLKSINHFNKVIQFISDKKDVNSLYNFLRYYTEFPIFTAEKQGEMMISDYRYVSDDIPSEYLDVSKELNIEFSFNKIIVNDNNLLVEGYAFIPFINHEESDSVSKKLIIVSETNTEEIILNNINTDETLDLGDGIYYYPFAGFDQSIQLKNENVRCFLELETKDHKKYRKYSFDIVDQKVKIDKEVQRSETNSIIRSINDPELLFIERNGDKVSLFLGVDNNIVNTLVNSPYKTSTIGFKDAVYNYSEIVKRDIEQEGITYINQPLLKFEVSTTALINEGKSYIVFNFGNKKQDIKYKESQKFVLDHMENEVTNMFISIFANKKNNIELHVEQKVKAHKNNKAPNNNIVRLLKKVKSRLGV